MVHLLVSRFFYAAPTWASTPSRTAKSCLNRMAINRALWNAAPKTIRAFFRNISAEAVLCLTSYPPRYLSALERATVRIRLVDQNRAETFFSVRKTKRVITVKQVCPRGAHGIDLITAASGLKTALRDPTVIYSFSSPKLSAVMAHGRFRHHIEHSQDEAGSERRMSLLLPPSGYD